MKKWMKEALLLGFLLICLSGCSVEKRTETKIKTLEYQIVSIETIPEKCRELMEQKKEEAFHFTYYEEDEMYFCVGYGRQETSGYSIQINDLFLTEKAVVLDTTLLGPSQEEIRKPTYPMVVLKRDAMQENVVFR